jgi:hypothetical protein
MLRSNQIEKFKTQYTIYNGMDKISQMEETVFNRKALDRALLRRNEAFNRMQRIYRVLKNTPLEEIDEYAREAFEFMEVMMSEKNIDR